MTIERPVVVGPEAGAAQKAAEELPVGPKTILIVDDEAEVAAVLAEALERGGHRTDIATNGAVAPLRLQSQTYDLVVSDTRMPGLNGQELYEEIQRRFPAICGRIIFLTGNVLSFERREFLERTWVPWLAKPCDLGHVWHLVRRVLVGGKSRPAARGLIPTVRAN